MNHEKSRKHKENVTFLRQAMEEEEGENGSSSDREDDKMTFDVLHDTPGMSHDTPDASHDASHDLPDCSTLDDIVMTKDSRTPDGSTHNGSTSDVEKAGDDDDDSSNMTYIKRQVLLV